MKEMPPASECSSPEEFFYAALKAGKEKSTDVLLLRDRFQAAYDRARDRVDQEKKNIEDLTGKPEKEPDWWNV